MLMDAYLKESCVKECLNTPDNGITPNIRPTISTPLIDLNKSLGDSSSDFLRTA